MKKTSLLLSALVLAFSAGAQSQSVGIGTVNPNTSAQLDISSTNKGFLLPRMTAAQRNAINTPAKGLLVYQTDGSAGFWYYNGSVWVQLYCAPVFGDVKTGMQTADHNGWIKLNGRAKSTLTSSQQAVASSLGIGTNLPDATNAFMVQDGGTPGTVSGTNTVTIAKNQLPNVTLSGTTSSYTHNHNTGDGTDADHTVDPGDYGLMRRSQWGESNTPFWTDSYGAGYEPDMEHTPHVIPDDTHAHTFTTSSINGGVTQQALNIKPKSLSVNTFIYLGS